MNKFIILFFVFLIFMVSIVSHKKQKLLYKSQIDSLEDVVNEKSLYLRYMERNVPNVLVKHNEAEHCSIILYEPFGLQIEIRSNRPNFNDNIFLTVPASFTTPANTIDGLFIENGEITSDIINQRINGVCIISKDSLKIISADILTKEFISHAKEKKNNVFQQVLLVRDSSIVDCEIFGNREDVRRAIIQWNDCVCIGESHRPITIREFQESLKSIGAVNAIYLDMGTWSEGWYKDYNRNRVGIGASGRMTNTNRQTNWLVFKKE